MNYPTAAFHVFLLAAFAANANAEIPNLQIADGPILLHANIDQQWGGHTFSYLLEGERSLFWSATMYNPDGNTWGSYIGQYPKPDADGETVVTPVRFTEPGVKSMTQPLLLRSPDGYIHIFIGVSHATDEPNYSPGTLRYFRSAAPENVSQLVDRTECIPSGAPYNAFHLRMNAGISANGQRAALVILAISKDGSVPFNTPVIFHAERQGEDFVFRNAIKYAEPQGFFYPQIALTDAGTIVVGQVWNKPERSTTRLMHLDTNGTLVHQEDLPAVADGNYWCLDLRPVATGADTANRNLLGLYYNKYPKGGQDCRHEFWTYSTQTRVLMMHRSIAVTEGQINYGKWLPVSTQRAVFIHNPSMGAFEAYDGDLFGSGNVATVSLTKTNPLTLGFVGSAYTFLPNPLQGSIATKDSVWFATDYISHKNDPKERSRSAMVLYRVLIAPAP